MAMLRPMPAVEVTPDSLRPFGFKWQQNGEKLTRTPPCSSNELGTVFNDAVGAAISEMLGGIPTIRPVSTSLRLGGADAVEVGECRVVGGIRPQNFDVVYRPDGVRFAFDAKTLNDTDSVRKNYQNMINDLGTEATTAHTMFPYAVVAFVVVIPTPCLLPAQERGLIGSLERLADRGSPLDSPHKAEAISLALWDPRTGRIDASIPAPSSPLRLEKLSDRIESAYVGRYKGLPPHD